MEDPDEIIAKLKERLKELEVQVTKNIPKSYRRKIGRQESSPGKFSPVIRFSASWLSSLGYHADGWFQYTICDDHIRITVADGPFINAQGQKVNAQPDERYRQTTLVQEEDSRDTEVSS